MEKNDFIVCKKNYYDKTNIAKIFKKTIFQEGKKYKILDIQEIGYAASAQTYMSSPGVMTSTILKLFKINNEVFTETLLSEYFYSKKEERNVKLQKIKKLQI